jgi:UDP-N-acetylmuramate--alanine ligase
VIHSSKEVLARWNEARRRGLPEEGALLIAEIAWQELTLLLSGEAVKTWAISTSRFGVGSRQDSQQTPPGWHRVCARYGDNAPPGTVLMERAPTGRVLAPGDWSRRSDEDLILTRILHLEGLEPGVNQGPGTDSRERCIYLHGTNHEQDIGRPASHGCLRLRNLDMIELFDRVNGRETWCWTG